MNGMQGALAFAAALGIAQAAVVDLTGKVVDESGNAVSNAKVRVGRAAMTAYTMTDGTFRVSEVAGVSTQGTTIAQLPIAKWVRVEDSKLMVNMTHAGSFQMRIWSASGQLLAEHSVNLPVGLHDVQMPEAQASEWTVLDLQADGQRAVMAVRGNGGALLTTPIRSLAISEPLGQALTLGSNVDTLVVSKALYVNDTLAFANYVSNVGTLKIKAEVSQPNLSLTADSLYKRGVILHDSSQYNFAIGFLDAAIAKGLTGTSAGDAAYYRADSYYHEAAYETALAGYQSVLGMSSNKKSTAQLGVADVWMIKSYRDSLLYPTARAEYQKVLSNFAGSAEIPDAIQAIGETYYFEKNYAAAITQFDQIINSYKATRADLVPSALYYKGRSLMSQTTPDYTTAITLFGQIISGYPTSVKMDNAKYSLAKCYYLKTPADYATSLTKFLDFRTSYPKSSYQDESYKYTSYIYVKQANCAKAKTERDEFKLLFPASPYFATTDAYVAANCP